MQVKGSGIKSLLAGNNTIQYSDDASIFDVYGEKNGLPILEGSFNKEQVLEKFSTCEIEVEKIETPW